MHTHITSITKRDTWLSTHANALLTYAATDAAFAESFAHHIQARNWASATTASPSTTTALTPTNQASAVQAASWLLATLDETTSATHTKGILNTWAQRYNEPKDFIFGIVGVDIIGPTLGIISKKKKTKGHLTIVIEKDWLKSHDKKALIELVQKLSQQVIAKELRLAGGNAYKLHPDTAAWLLEEPLTKVFTADKAELTNLQQTSEAEALLHTVEPNIAIAISPTVQDRFVEEFAVEKI